MKSPLVHLKQQLIHQVIPLLLEEIDPGLLLRKKIQLRNGRLRWNGGSFMPGRDRSIYVVGAGKGAARMAAALEAMLGDMLTAGVVVTPYGYRFPCETVRVIEGGHPIPDRSGARGAREILALARRSRKEDLLIGLWSGGGSALLPAPLPGITLAQKRRVTDLLLKSGATISEINTVRKHLSQIKGGRLAEASSAAMVDLILSDVVGDRLDVIASGPTVPDPTLFSDAIEILKRYSLWTKIGSPVRKVLDEGRRGVRGETPKPGHPRWRRIHHVLIGNGEAAVGAAARAVAKIGYRPKILTPSLVGEAREVGKVFAALAKEERRKRRRGGGPVCLLAGGETTVTVRGNGRGGRCQEFTLSAALSLEGVPGITFAAFSTDGTDGPTDAAGAIADGESGRRGERKNLDPRRCLKESNAYAFFSASGGLIRTGPTRNHLNDLYLAFID
jgi:hydroxypyruvate reductase